MNERAAVLDVPDPDTQDRQVPTLVPRQRMPTQHSWWASPATLGEAMELAQLIANSEFAPKDYRGKAASVLIAIRMGHDVGLSPMQSLQNIAVINGRPAIWGDAALALVQSASILTRFHETFEGTPGTDGFMAVCVAQRRGWPDEVRRTFSVADARRAFLWGKTGREGQPTPWVTYPNRMLQMRARGFALRDVAADRLMGLILAEEAMDLPTVQDGGSGVLVPMPEAPPPSAFDRIPEALRDNLEKAFNTLSLSPGLRVAKLHEFCPASVDPEEGAKALLEWCKDEYAKRKTGRPRSQAAKPKPSEKPSPTPKREEPPTSTVPVQEPPATELPPPPAPEPPPASPPTPAAANGTPPNGEPDEGDLF